MKQTKLIVCVCDIHVYIACVCCAHACCESLCGGQKIYFDLLLYFILSQGFSCEPRDQGYSYSGYPSCYGYPPVSTPQIPGYRQASTPMCHLWECYKPDPQYSFFNGRYFIHWTISLVSSKWSFKDTCYHTENLKVLKIIIKNTEGGVSY